MFEIDYKSLQWCRFDHNMLEIHSVRNLLYVMYNMDYGDKIFPEDEFVGFEKIEHKMENYGITSNRVDLYSHYMFLFKKAGRTFRFEFNDEKSMHIQVQQSENQWDTVDFVSYYRYDPTETLREYNQ